MRPVAARALRRPPVDGTMRRTGTRGSRRWVAPPGGHGDERMTTRRTLLLGALGAAAWQGGARAQAVTAAARAALAPTGVLRAAINYGNAVLARHDPATGALSGVSVDIAGELGRRLDVPVTLVPFDAAGKVTAAALAGVWDVAFLARDPTRAQSIAFTAAYVVIEGTYVVRRDSPLTAASQVDRDGIRIVVDGGSAYDLFLSRALRHATIIRADSTPQAVARFGSEHLEVMAGVRQGLAELMATDPTLRMLPEPFMTIDQAMGVPAGRPDAEAYLHGFVEQLKSSGEAARILARNGQADAMVAAPA